MAGRKAEIAKKENDMQRAKNATDCDSAFLVLSSKTPQAWKYEKIRPTPGLAPKIRKNTLKIRNRSFLGHFRIFSVFLSYFRGCSGW